MAPKRSSTLKIMSAAKKSRRVINLETKLDIINRSERGFSGAAIARALGLRDSTVRTILNNSDRIKKISAERIPPPPTNNEPRKIQILTIRPRPIISKTTSLEIENALGSWYASEVNSGNIVDFETFKEKGLSIYKDLTKDYINAGMYSVNHEVYEFFKRRFTAVSATSSEAASADTEDINSAATNFAMHDNNAYDIQTANAFTQSFHDLVEEGKYTPHQIFSVREVHLFWKRLPIKEVTAKLDTNDRIDHVTLLLGCNASGDFKLKPLLVNFIENPKALNGYPKDKLPVIWKTNKKASITQLIFCDWFTSYFCPAVEHYCFKNNLDNKVLLVINSSPVYPTSLEDLSNNVKVIFLPSKAESILQPLDENFIKIYKANYHFKMISHALSENENAKQDDVRSEDLWKSYDIRKAINNIVEGWNDISPTIMNKLWRQLFPNYVSDFSGFDEDIDKMHKNIAEIVKELGLEEISKDYFLEELEFNTDKITEEQKLQFINHKNIEDVENNDDVIQIKSLSASMLGDAIKNFETAMDIISENDPDSERSSNVCYVVKKAISDYRQLYRDKMKQSELPVDNFLRNQSSITVESSEHSIALDVQSTNSNEPQPSNIPVDIKLEFSPAQSPCSDT